MSITLDEVNRIAKLVRLEFTPDEKQKLQQEMSAILDYVDQLKEIESQSLDLEVDPVSLNLVREDVVESPLHPEQFLSQAPSCEGKYLKVKSILD